MAYTGAPYSGSYGFIETEMYWPITHMVAPASESLTCQGCHVEEGGHLDFVALGYPEEKARALSSFPPRAQLGTISPITDSPDACRDCHQDQSTEWDESHHGRRDVGCVSCHILEGEAIHPDSPYSISRDANVCGACHLDEYHDWQQSIHANLGDSKTAITCVNCHEPHSLIQKVPGDHMTSCDTCHVQLSEEIHTSTHAKNGVTCIDCHKVTEIDTGHTFKIREDTCTRCHGADAHSAAMLVMLAGAEPDETTKDEELADAPASDQPEGANVVIPAWGYIVIGLVLGIAGYWVVKGKEPGIGAESMTDGSDGE
jgi:hypothetical protein